MRFDDSLETVLAADISSPIGAQSAWRQLVDLIGRGRVTATDEALARLREIRSAVPASVRSASARALAFASPPVALVRLFAEDDLAIAAPVLRIATLKPEEWIGLLPQMPSACRAILRHRRDLGPDVERALAAFGSSDFVLSSPADSPVEQATDPIKVNPITDAVNLVSNAPLPVEAQQVASADQDLARPIDDSSFVSLASVALGLPVVVDAMRRAELGSPGDAVIGTTSAPSDPPLQPIPGGDEPLGDPLQPARGPFQISDIVARIDAFQRHRTEQDGDDEEDGLRPRRVEGFQFETDATGTFRWILGTAREPLIGLSLDMAAVSFGARVDGIASGAFRRRSRFVDARLLVDGSSETAGQWRITGIPIFDRESGRFTGYRGTGRRPRADERAEAGAAARTTATDSVRQLVHELRTPTTAIAGFAEMIEGELLGPVPAPYIDYAATIRHQTSGLLEAIDDLDTAARIDSQALDLRETSVELPPLLSHIVADLRPLASLRRATLTLFAEPGSVVRGDDRAIDRVVGRLIATLVGSAGPDETIMVTTAVEGQDTITIAVDRPRAFGQLPGDALLSADSEPDDGDVGPPLLGTGFALRLVRNLAAELGGSLAIGGERLTLRLPAAVSRGVGQASNK